MPHIKCTGIVCPVNGDSDFRDEILPNDAATFTQMSLPMAKTYEGDVADSNIPVKITHVPNSIIGNVTKLYVAALPKCAKKAKKNRIADALFADFIIDSENFMRAIQIAVRESYRNQNLVSTDGFVPKGGKGGPGEVHEVDVYKVLAGRLPGLSLSHKVVDGCSAYPIDELSMCIKGVRDYSVLTSATYHEDGDGEGVGGGWAGNPVSDENIHRLGNWGDESFQKMLSKICGLHTGANVDLFMGTKKRMDGLGMDSSVMSYAANNQAGGDISDKDPKEEEEHDNHTENKEKGDVTKKDCTEDEEMATAPTQPDPSLQAPTPAQAPPPQTLPLPLAGCSTAAQPVYVIRGENSQGNYYQPQHQQQREFVIARPAQQQQPPPPRQVHQELYPVEYLASPPPPLRRRPYQRAHSAANYHHDDEVADDGYYDDGQPLRGGRGERVRQNAYDEQRAPPASSPPPQERRRGGGGGALRRVRQYRYEDENEGYQSRISRGTKRQHSEEEAADGVQQNQNGVLKMLAQYLEDQKAIPAPPPPQQSAPPPPPPERENTDNTVVLVEAIKQLQENMKNIQEAVAKGGRREDKMETEVQDQPAVVEEEDTIERKKEPCKEGQQKSSSSSTNKDGVNTRKHQYALRGVGHRGYSSASHQGSSTSSTSEIIKQNAANFLDLYNEP